MGIIIILILLFDLMEPVGDPVLSYIIAAFILITAVGLTGMPYKRFSNP
jgi:hypothetical protein